MNLDGKSYGRQGRSDAGRWCRRFRSLRFRRVHPAELGVRELVRERFDIPVEVAADRRRLAESGEHIAGYPIVFVDNAALEADQHYLGFQVVTDCLDLAGLDWLQRNFRNHLFLRLVRWGYSCSPPLPALNL